MNRDTLQGNWTQFKGKIKETWGRLTDDELKMVDGKRDKLVGVIQKKYGLAKDEVERQLAEHAHRCGCE